MVGWPARLQLDLRHGGGQHPAGLQGGRGQDQEHGQVHPGAGGGCRGGGAGGAGVGRQGGAAQAPQVHHRLWPLLRGDGV